MWTFLNYKRSPLGPSYLGGGGVCVHILSCPWFRVHTWVWLCRLLHPWVALQSSFLAQVFLTQSEALFLLVSNMCWLMQNSKCGSHGILSHRINVPYRLMPRPSTGPKLFWAAPNFLGQTFGPDEKLIYILCPTKRWFPFSKFGFCASTKGFSWGTKYN